MLTPEENAALDELNGLSSEIAGAMQSPWEPACVARAFRAPGAGSVVFTMEGWIGLEAIRSPLLQGGLPADVEELAAAAAIFGLGIDDLTPEEAVDLASAMRRAVSEAFAMSLRMEQPAVETDAAAEPDGFGAWLPLYACLVTQCGLSRAEARACPVGEAYALTAAHRRNQGWRVAGTPYALRHMERGEDGGSKMDDGGGTASNPQSSTLNPLS